MCFYIKDIIVWFLFSGLIYCMNAVSQEADEEFIRKVLKDNLKLTAILEFIISTFTFNIWVELAIIPITTMIVMMNVIAERKEEYEKVHKLLDIVLTVAGFWILYETIKIGIHEYKELDALNTFISFMIPIVYLILIIPLEYILELYSKYELLFVRMSFKEEKDKKIQRRHRWLVIKVCKLSVHHPNGYYDLVFMDVQMPIMNGYEAATAIRSLPKHKGELLPIVAMTANAFTEDVILAKSAGMNEHIAKPLDMEKLNRMLHEWM